MAARSWAEFDADLASGKSAKDRDRDFIVKLGIDGSVPFAQARKNVGLTICPPAIAKGASFMGGKPDLRRKRKAA